MTIDTDISTALAAYSVKLIAYANYNFPRSTSIEHYVLEVHVEHPLVSNIPTIVAALRAITGYHTIIARLTSSWPLAGFFYSRFEVEIFS